MANHSRQPTETSLYAHMFDIEVLPVNRAFVERPYKPRSCRGTNVVCFSIANGARGCKGPSTNLLYTAEGSVHNQTTQAHKSKGAHKAQGLGVIDRVSKTITDTITGAIFGGPISERRP